MSNDVSRSQRSSAVGPNVPRPSSITVATVNDDFGSKASNLPRVKRKVDVMMAQECKYENVKHLLGQHEGVNQDMSTEATKGSTVSWNKKAVEVKGGGIRKMSDPGHGTLARYLTFEDVKMKGSVVRVAAVHRPPARSSANWPQFDANLRKFIRNSPYPTLVGMDSNTDPAAMKKFAQSAGAKWHVPAGPTRHGERIDGFITTPGIRLTDIHRLPAGSSDHTPVVVDIHVVKQQQKATQLQRSV